MEEILKHEGGNNFKLKHVGKDKLQRQRLLPKNVQISPDLYQTTKAFMDGYMAANSTHTSQGTQFIHETNNIFKCEVNTLLGILFEPFCEYTKLIGNVGVYYFCMYNQRHESTSF
ncbi:unnamed protein product [Cuscuta epithymum]|uniref:DNA-directed RNA polymerase n=1 Tax=Cuscuta epithymum TaxID=186058 RepID=A0AAV0DS60_9ASTE|nr:unnamed protein product [Cuscuta epithymum]